MIEAGQTNVEMRRKRKEITWREEQRHTVRQLSVFLDSFDNTDEVKWKALSNTSGNPQRTTHISCPDSHMLDNFPMTEWKNKNTEKCPWPYSFSSHYPLQ